LIRLLLWICLFFQTENKATLTLEIPVSLAIPTSDPLLGYVARTGVTVSIADASLDPRFNNEVVDSLLICGCAVLCEERNFMNVHGTYAFVQIMQRYTQYDTFSRSS
jgi:hypothetical protein